MNFWVPVNLVVQFHYLNGFIVWMKNHSLDPDQVALLEPVDLDLQSF